MADSGINITPGLGTTVDTRAESTNGHNRQVIVIGDPADNDGVAPVDGTNGLSVNITNASVAVADSTAASTLSTISSALTTLNGQTDTLEAKATGPTAGAITSVTGVATDATILAANANRKGAIVYNESSAILYLALASTTASSTNYTIQVPANTGYELPPIQGGVYTGVIKGIWASATGAARVTENT